MVRNFLGPVLGQSGRTELPNVKFSCFGEFLETYFITECLQIDPRTSKGSQWGPQGSPPMVSLGLQGFPSHGGSWTPAHGIPWAHKGSHHPHGSPPMPLAPSDLGCNHCSNGVLAGGREVDPQQLSTSGPRSETVFDPMVDLPNRVGKQNRFW